MCKIMTKKLTKEDRKLLLNIARSALEEKISGKQSRLPDLEQFPDLLRQPGACFCTLKHSGKLRGCVGSLEAVQPLVLEVRVRALGAAFEDFRFPPLTREELPELVIEISRLTAPQNLEFSSPDSLLEKLRPGKDGVVLSYRERKATFLPQVWEQLSDPEQFLSRLCLKMGLSGSAWQEVPLEVKIYEVEKFSESDN